MRAIQFMFYNSSLVLKELPKLTLTPRTGLESKYVIKVHYSPINPSDLGFIAGRYGRYQDGVFPKTAGFEGSGIIVDSDSEAGRKNIGKKVSFLSNYENKYYSGAWTDYTIVGENEKVILPDESDLKENCCLMVNPLTALSFLHIAKSHEAKSVFHSAGSSSLGKMLTRIFTKYGIDIINTVRKEKHVEDLKLIGGKNTILSTNSEELRNGMKEISNQMRPKLAFECIGGENTGIMFEFLCEEGILYHYGNLSLTPISNVLTKDMLFKNKTMKGFWLTNYLKSLNEEELKAIYTKLIEYKITTDFFNVNIVNVFKPNQVELAIKTYRNDMGKGKIILDFTN